MSLIILKSNLFSIADYAFLFQLCQDFKIAGLRFGGNAKIIHRKAGDFGKAWDLDLISERNITAMAGNSGSWLKMSPPLTMPGATIPICWKKLRSKTNNEIPKTPLKITLPKLILGPVTKYEFSKNHRTHGAECGHDFDGQRNVLISSNPVSVIHTSGLEIGYANFIFLRVVYSEHSESKRFLTDVLPHNCSTEYGCWFAPGQNLQLITYSPISAARKFFYSNVFSL